MLRKSFRREVIPVRANRRYGVHLPANYNPAEKLPLVMVLHTCLQRGSSSLPFMETIEADSKFNDVADQERFIVVYPNHKLNPMGGVPFCWEWWIDANIHRGHGDVADLAGIVKDVQNEYRLDPNRVHIAGFASGGAMAVAALVAYPDVFASGSTTAGLPYSETQQNYMLHTYKPVDDIAAAMSCRNGCQ